MLCFRCGHDNPYGIYVCGSCGAKLPKLETAAVQSSSAPKTVRLMKVLDIANKILDAKRPLEDLLDEVHIQIESFHKSEQYFKSIKYHKSLKKEFQPQIDEVFNGIYLFLESVELMKKALEEGILPEEELPEEELPEEGEEGLFELTKEGQDMVKEAMEKANEANEILNKCFESSEDVVRKAREEARMYEADSTIL